VTPVVALAQAIVVRVWESILAGWDTLLRHGAAIDKRLTALGAEIEGQTAEIKTGANPQRGLDDVWRDLEDVQRDLEDAKNASTALDMLKRESERLKSMRVALKEAQRGGLRVVAVAGFLWLVHLGVLIVALVSLAERDDVMTPLAPGIAEVTLFGATPLLARRCSQISHAPRAVRLCRRGRSRRLAARRDPVAPKTDGSRPARASEPMSSRTGGNEWLCA
jgi:hypothetical protein